MSLRDFINNLDNPEYDPFDGVADTHAPDALYSNEPSEKPAHIEVTVDNKTGQARQAGASQAEGPWLTQELRPRLEGSLYAFTKGVLKRDYLSPTLHVEVSQWAAQRNLFRKLLLLPRNHAKTSIISHGLPIHILIQPKENNIYIPGRAGVDTRIMLAGETERRASNNLSVVQAAFEGNSLLRGLWPHVCWENPRKQADKWNKIEMVLPRSIDFPDPTVQAIGVGGAITGARHDIHIKDDLISFEAANSMLVMETAIAWHLASRALLDTDTSLEFIIGTRWAVNDLYDFIMHGGILDGEKFEKDYTVDCVVRSIVEDGRVIYPEKFSVQRERGKKSVVELQKEHGTMFPLLYMNSAADPSLVDFDIEDVRRFAFNEGQIEFTEDERDALLCEKLKVKEVEPPPSGMRLNSDTYDLLLGRAQFIRRVRAA